MPFAITSRWNASRHAAGEPMIEELLGLGFTHVELGYDLRIEQVPGVLHMVNTGAVQVDSVHNFCPVPMGAMKGHPELYTLADPDRLVRENAVKHTIRTIRFAAEVHARAIVVHCGNVSMKRLTMRLIDLIEAGEQLSGAFEKTKLKLQVAREKKSAKQLGYLRQGLTELLPVLEEAKVRLAMENLPSWESIPTELELEELLKEFNSPHLGYWHDIGHGQIRENIGMINQERWIERLHPWLVGMHIHDVQPPARDHLLPPQGKIDFARFARFATIGVCRVIEPSPNASREDIVEALRFMRGAWASAGE